MSTTTIALLNLMKINKHAKMKNKMNKTMKYLSMAALALVGAVMTGCSKDDIVDIDQPGSNNVERLTVVANLDGSTSRALTNEGVKTYAVGDKIAVVYKNTSGNTVKAESDALTDGDITGSGKSAKFTVTLVDADKNQNVTYIYPAAMAKENGDVNYDALYNEQDGTLATLASKFDYCTFTGAWNEGKLPTADLTNELFVCEFTLKYGGASINDKVTAMTISDNATHNYYVNIDRTPSSDPIYVAIIPTSNNDINYTAIADGKVYTKSVKGKTYAAGTMRPIILNMDQNNDLLPGLFSVSASKKAYFAKGNLRYVSGTWSFFDHQYDYYNAYNENNWDKFCWVGASGALNSEPDKWGISTSIANSDFGTNADDNLKSDWGYRIGTDWRTPTNDEWTYLLKTRDGATSKFGFATVNGVYGIIILPDAFVDPKRNMNEDTDDFVGKDTNNYGYDRNVYNSAGWALMEAAGAVFLPAAGDRLGVDFYGAGTEGYYWSSTAAPTTSYSNAYLMRFVSNSLSIGNNTLSRGYGLSVRLVRDAK